MSEKFNTFDEEYRWHLSNRLDKRSKTYMTLFRGTIIFAFVFLAFILIPLVVLQHEEYKYKTAVEKLDTKKKDLEELQLKKHAIKEQLIFLPDQLRKLNDDEATKKDDIKKIDSDLQRIQQKIVTNTAELSKLEEDRNNMAKIQDRFLKLLKYDTKQTAQKLRKSLRELERKFSRISERQTDPCASADMNEFVRCKVEQIIHEELKKYQTVISDADQVLSGYAELSGKTLIDNRIEQVLKKLDQKMEENPQFWHTFGGKISFFGKLGEPMQKVYQEVDLQVRSYKETLDSQKQKIVDDRQLLKEVGDSLKNEKNEQQEIQKAINGEIMLLNKKSKELEAQKSQLDKDLSTNENTIATLTSEIVPMQEHIEEIKEAKNGIATRLEKIQSPFGPLPVGLNEAVLAFPVALAIAIVMFALALADIIRLRSLYHHATRLCYPEDDKKIAGSISVLAPAWLDPIGKESYLIFRIFILSLPALAYMIALLLVFYSWYIVEPQPGSTGLIRNGYLVLYILGVFGLMFGGLRIKQEWSNYRIKI